MRMPRVFHLVILTAFWGRSRVSNLVQDYLARLDIPTVKITRVGVISPGDPDLIKRHAGWDYVAAPNQPLSNKWQAGVDFIRDAYPDLGALMIVGSDDLISRPYFHQVVKHLRDGVEYQLFNEFHALDLKRWEATAVANLRVGTGRVISRGVLDRASFNVWPPGKTERLDTWMERRCLVLPRTTREYTLAKASGCLAVGLKGYGDMNPPEKYHHPDMSPRSMDADMLVGTYFPDLYEHVKALSVALDQSAV